MVLLYPCFHKVKNVIRDKTQSVVPFVPTITWLDSGEKWERYQVEYEKNMQQIPPHANKEECDSLFESGQVYSCAKPFRIQGGNTIHAVICDYI
jgi:hypothetical protein